jgi:hypothetical protein
LTDTLVTSSLAASFAAVVVVAAIPAFMLRATGVMDDSVFWVVAHSVDYGQVLYRDVFFTQPPLSIFVAQGLWMLSSNIFVHRAFLVGVWLLNGWLFHLILDKLDRTPRLVATSLFLVSAFILQSYALHTEIFILTLFLVAVLAIQRPCAQADLILGLATSAALLVKPLAPLVFLPCAYHRLSRHPDRWLHFVAGVSIPIVIVSAYLVAHGTADDFIQQVVRDNASVGLSLSDWQGYFTLAVAPLLLPLFVALVAVDLRPRDSEWWLTLGVFAVLLLVELLRGARHYGLFNLCILVWLTARAQGRLSWQSGRQQVVLAALTVVGLIGQSATVSEVLSRGSITEELTASRFQQALAPGTLQVFANDAPRVYMLLNELRPAYPYLFVYDTNRDLVIWDNYMRMIDQTPPDYIAVADSFTSVEYGSERSTQLVDAAAVKSWIDSTNKYQRLDEGQNLGLTMYRYQPGRSI